jgi:hypothetical protein
MRLYPSPTEEITLIETRNRGQIARVEDKIGYPPDSGAHGEPYYLFLPSARINRLSWPAAAGLVIGWALRAADLPARYAVCKRVLWDGCVLGGTKPPCSECIRFSDSIFPKEATIELPYTAGQDLASFATRNVWASAAWASRSTTHVRPELLDSFYSSARRLANWGAPPGTAVVFNGVFFPESVFAGINHHWTAFECGLAPASLYIGKDAAFRELKPVHLTAPKLAIIDAYIEERRRGGASMAGHKVWTRMEPLPWAIKDHPGVVAVFPNVPFDTSQFIPSEKAHSEHLFDSMWDWLDAVSTFAEACPDDLYVIRAHPDEVREFKESKDRVRTWFYGAPRPRNMFLIDADWPVDSYALIEKAESVMVYTSTIGLEAAIMGKPVSVGGYARYFDAMRGLVATPTATTIDVFDKEKTAAAAKGLLYYDVFEASIDLSDFVDQYTLKPFDPELLRTHPSAIKIVDRIKETST